MVIVKGAFPVKQSSWDAARELLNGFAEASRREAGCLAYEVYSRLDDPSTLVVWQQWRTSASMQNHFSSDSMEDFLDRLVVLLDGQVDTLYFDVQTDAEPQAADAPELSFSAGGSVDGSVTLH